MSTAYSGTPLAKKLSLKDGSVVCFLDMPASVRDEIEASDLELFYDCEAPQAVHLFVTEERKLVESLTHFRSRISQNGQIWVSWPKKASKVQTDITEGTIRDVCLPMGLVDVKVCSVDAIWSGLKLVIRKELRET